MPITSGDLVAAARAVVPVIATADAQKLIAVELELTSLRAEEPLPRGRFTPTHYRRIHHHLFQDIYAWAGQYRTIRTAKGGNWFCFPEHIDSQMKRLFGKLKKSDYLRETNAKDFSVAAATFLAELNAIHPFREGNGRAQLSFMTILSIEAGHPLRIEDVREETFMPAMIASFSGDLKPLVSELVSLI
jgi:cell filamentation protein